MAELKQLKTHDNYLDSTIVEIDGPDGSVLRYQYDEQQRAFYTRETSIPFTGRHGTTHIGTDPIPAATCTTPGLMAADDKCRLDALIGTRIGVLGFTGAGFPDDGGFMDGDVILAAGSEAISLERVGNVIRFVVDMPAIFSCSNEDCLQIYWVQDETDIAAIRPPINGGKLAGVNSYGELKVYLFPENTLINPANPSTTLLRKAFYPSFIFKRYDDGIGANEGEIDLVLKRNEAGTSIVGWGFTPGATGKPEWQVFLGVDDDNNRISFKLDGSTNSGVLGALLYNGHVITKRAAIITSYDPTVVSSNIYRARWWDTHNKEYVGDEFSITNQIQWDLTTDTPVVDAASDSLLPIGQIVDVWSFRIGETNGQPMYVHYCRTYPPINTGNLWTTIGSIQFGDLYVDSGTGTGIATTDDLIGIESSQWGAVGIGDELNIYNTGDGGYATAVNRRSAINTSIPALVVQPDAKDPTRELPVMLWHRANLRDAYLEIHLARPEQIGATNYPPIDVMLRAPVDSSGRKYGRVTSKFTINGGDHDQAVGLVITGIAYEAIQANGNLRIVYNTTDFDYGTGCRYIAKMANYAAMGSVIVVVAADSVTIPAVDDIVEFSPSLLKCTTARFQFEYNSGHDIIMQPTVGLLDTTINYGGDDGVRNDNAGTFEEGYAVGGKNWQDGAVIQGSTGISSFPNGFIVYTGSGGSGEEVFNILRIKVEDYKVWIWWNDLLLPPSITENAALPTPMDISSPYYPIMDVVQYGKFGLRLWPGAKIRRFIVKSKPTKFSEFTFGQLEVV